MSITIASGITATGVQYATDASGNVTGLAGLNGAAISVLPNSVGNKLRRLSERAGISNPLVNAPLIAPAAWVASTAYTMGYCVSNGGNLYACYTAGTSASSGGPTGTGANVITDGTVTWHYAGVSPIASNSPVAPIMSFSASAIGALNNHYLTGTNDASFYYSGGKISVGTFGQYYFPSTTVISGGNANGSTQLNNFSFAVSFCTDAPKLAIRYPGSNTGYRLIVDGQYVELSAYSQILAGSTYAVMDFTNSGGRKDRTITFESGANMGFYGVDVDPASKVWAPAFADKIRVIAVGDSITGGANAYPYLPRMGWIDQVSKYLGISDPWNTGLGGSGYISTNSGTTYNFIQHINDVLLNAPDLIIVAGGFNDRLTNTAAAVQAATLTYLQTLRASLASVPIIVLGIWGEATGPDASTLTAEAAIKAAVVQMNDSQIFFVPISTDPAPWETGTGKITGPTGSGNADVYISSDGIHPDQAGINYKARRVTKAIKQLIPSIL